MHIQGIHPCSASIAIVLLAGCTSAPVEPVSDLESAEPDFISRYAETQRWTTLGPVTLLDRIELDRIELGRIEADESFSGSPWVGVFPPQEQPTNQTYLRNANLVPTDLFGTRIEQRAWYETSAVRVDNDAAIIFGNDSPLFIPDESRWIFGQLLDRTPGSDPE